MGRRGTLPALGGRTAALLSALVLAAACATTAGKGTREPALDARISEIARVCACRMGIAARHIESGKVYERNADREFEAASVIKIAIATEAMAQARENRIDLSERWTLTAENKADGAGTLLVLDPGLNPTWNDLITLMIGPSDNTAANAWIRRLGIENINSRMDSLGFHHIRLLSPIPPASSGKQDPSPWTGFRLGTVTPRDVAEWMARVAQGELLDPNSSRLLFDYLDQEPTRLRIARRFPSEFLWAGKSGTMSGVRNDAGILRTRKGRFVLVFLTDGSAARSPSAADHPSVLAIADAARTIVDSWSRELPDLTEKPK
jgi:beta-lactamase class A